VFLVKWVSEGWEAAPHSPDSPRTVGLITSSYPRDH
jgi:hypothetical protein